MILVGELILITVQPLYQDVLKKLKIISIHAKENMTVSYQRTPRRT